MRIICAGPRTKLWAPSRTDYTKQCMAMAFYINKAMMQQNPTAPQARGSSRLSQRYDQSLDGVRRSGHGVIASGFLARCEQLE